MYIYMYVYIYVCIYNICIYIYIYIYIYISKNYLILIFSIYCISYDSLFGFNRNF